MAKRILNLFGFVLPEASCVFQLTFVIPSVRLTLEAAPTEPERGAPAGSDKPDKVAKALLEWALDRGASCFCHWFQPMCGFKRHGQAACVQVGPRAHAGALRVASKRSACPLPCAARHVRL